MIEAFTVLAEQAGTFPPVGLALVVSEEEDNSGAKALVDEYSFSWAIVGEPTDISPCLGPAWCTPSRDTLQIRGRGPPLYASPSSDAETLS